MVSTGEVQVTGTRRAYVDARAGGARFARYNPFIYVSLTGDTVQKVDITDSESYVGGGWDLALKREVIRVNGGDSGPGNIQVAVQIGASLDQVTQAPAEDRFKTDDWATDSCQYNGGFLGEPETAIGLWYQVDPKTDMQLPETYVYVLKRPNGSMIKLRVITYFYDGFPAQYELEWAPL